MEAKAMSELTTCIKNQRKPQAPFGLPGISFGHILHLGLTRHGQESNILLVGAKADPQRGLWQLWEPSPASGKRQDSRMRYSPNCGSPQSQVIGTREQRPINSSFFGAVCSPLTGGTASTYWHYCLGKKVPQLGIRIQIGFPFTYVSQEFVAPSSTQMAWPDSPKMHRGLVSRGMGHVCERLGFSLSFSVIESL